jgi:tRNA (cytidine/uridine-2'-O-)-methyltransferase
LSFHIVLVEPEIPQNTGNIARTCVATGAHLHLVGPLGFTISDTQLKRAGLDYWDDLQMSYYPSFVDFEEKNKGGRFYCATTKATKTYASQVYQQGDYLLFGKETKGLSDTILKKYTDCTIRIPMTSDVRSLNLSNSVAIILYEAYRQVDFSFGG